MEKIFKKNEYGIRIRICCASCVYKQEHMEETRKCELYDSKVFPDSLCSGYKVHPRYLNVGSKCDGQVKRKEWMDFFHAFHGATLGSKEDGTPLERKTKLISVIAKNWEKSHGSRFIDI